MYLSLKTTSAYKINISCRAELIKVLFKYFTLQDFNNFTCFSIRYRLGNAFNWYLHSPGELN